MRNRLANLRPRGHRPSTVRRAFTLVELLVSMALTLIIVYAMAEFYARVGISVRDGRALIELRGQLRNVSQKLQSDLNSLTVKGNPSLDEAAGLGYFELHEGGRTDIDADGDGTVDVNQLAAWSNLGVSDLLGDADDIFAGTIQASEPIFTGRTPSGGVAQSRLAEVIWFVAFDDDNVLGRGNNDGIWSVDEPRRLYRRQLLIMPELNNNPAAVGGGFVNPLTDARQGLIDWYQSSDISVHVEDIGGQLFLRANTLGDLSLRQNRFAHQPLVTAFPNRMEIVSGGAANYTAGYLSNEYIIGFSSSAANNVQSVTEDLMINNLLAFDIRVFDPVAPIYENPGDANEPLTPVDPGFPGSVQIGSGAYVDLGNGRYPPPVAGQQTFASPPTALSQLDPQRVYDTWTTFYERAAPGTFVNGIDDNNNGIVDDLTERQALPPYNMPLKGLQIRIRVQETTSRQVQQATVSADFVVD